MVQSKQIECHSTTSLRKQSKKDQVANASGLEKAASHGNRHLIEQTHMDNGFYFKGLSLMIMWPST